MVVAKTVVVTLRGTGERTGVGEGLKEVGEVEGEGLEVGEGEGLKVEAGEGEDVGI